MSTGYVHFPGTSAASNRLLPSRLRRRNPLRSHYRPRENQHASSSSRAHSPGPEFQARAPRRRGLFISSYTGTMMLTMIFQLPAHGTGVGTPLVVEGGTHRHWQSVDRDDGRA